MLTLTRDSRATYADDPCVCLEQAYPTRVFSHQRDSHKEPPRHKEGRRGGRERRRKIGGKERIREEGRKGGRNKEGREGGRKEGTEEGREGGERRLSTFSNNFSSHATA